MGREGKVETLLDGSMLDSRVELFTSLHVNKKVELLTSPTSHFGRDAARLAASA